MERVVAINNSYIIHAATERTTARDGEKKKKKKTLLKTICAKVYLRGGTCEPSRDVLLAGDMERTFPTPPLL